jgi:hypothetical protein
MARIAEMEQVGRWAGREHEPFTDDGASHVSVWQKRQN